MKCFTTVYDDARLLPFFLDHYRKLGATSFYIGLPLAKGSVDVEEVKNLARHHNYRLYTIPCDYQSADVEAVWRNTLRQEQVAADEWHFVADLDEFQVYNVPIKGELMQTLDAQRANCVVGFLTDCIAADGSLKALDPGVPLATQYPLHTNILNQFVPGVAHKVCLVKGTNPITPGLHTMRMARPMMKVIDVLHYRWLDTAMERLRQRCEDYYKGESSVARKYHAILEHLEANGGRFNFDKPPFSGRD